MNTSFKQIDFKAFPKERFPELQAIIDADKDKRKGQNILGDVLDYPTLQGCCSGQLFCLEEDEMIVAFAFCIDSFEKGKFTQKTIDQNFPHDYWYLKDLAAVGKYSYIKQIVVHPGFRNKGRGSFLSGKVREHYQQKDGAILIGSVIQVDNRDTIGFFKQVLEHYMFIDYYKSPKTGEVIWHRVVSILDKRRFFKSINSTKLTKAFRTIIPIQLNLTTRSINSLFEKLQSPAEILWSSFFQLDEMMEREYGMQNVYNGYYQSLLNSKDDDVFEKVKSTLHQLIDYLVKKDKPKDGEEGVASLSESMRTKAYDFFLLNLEEGVDGQEYRKYFNDFGRPVVVNIDSLGLPNLASNKEIGIISYADPGNPEHEGINDTLIELLSKRYTRAWNEENKAELEKQLQKEYEKRLFTQKEKEKIEAIFSKESLFRSEAGIWKNLLTKQATGDSLSDVEQEKWNDLVSKKFPDDPQQASIAIEATTYTKEFEKNEKRLNDLRKLKYTGGLGDPLLETEYESLKKSQRLKEEEYYKKKAFLESFRVEHLSETEKELRQNLLDRLPVSRSIPKKWASWLALHDNLYEADQQANQDLSTWCHAVVPISFSGGLIGVMFTFIIKKKNNAPVLAQNELMELINFLSVTISNALSKNIFNIHLKLRNGIIEKYLRQFAVSSVMARNMSHNIGSHVLSRISTPKGIMLPLTNEPTQNGNPLENQLTYLSSFNHTLRTRMDFLADISTARPVAAVPMNFKKEIIDNFRNENVILKYISGTDTIHIHINFHEDFEEDIDIQVPNGHLGRQAFYIILENIIRNCAKHETIPSNGEGIPELRLCIQKQKIEVSEALDDRNYRIIIYDNIVRKSTKLIEELNDSHIGAPIIHKDKIRPFGWGMLEMKIAAAYIRKEAPANIDELKNTEIRLPLLRARAIALEDDSKEGYYLGYEFFLKKPRELLIIDTQNYFEKLADHEASIKRGIRIIQPKSISRSIFIKEEAFTHEIAILIGDGSRDKIEKKKVLPLRWIQLKEPKEIEDLQQLLIANQDDLLLRVWKSWLAQFIQNKRLPYSTYLVVTDDDELDESYELSQTILFDLHYEKLNKESFHVDELAYYEAYSNNSKSGKLIQYMPTEDLAYERLEIEMIEAALTEVAILDERVQHELEQQIDVRRADAMTRKGISIYQELDWMKIYIPSATEINLNSESFTEEQKKVFRTWISRRMKMSELDFIIIHIGIIEKMFGASDKSLDSFIGFLKEQNPKTEIVLTSGRGRPHYIPENTLFIHYSNLAHYLFEERSKFHFVKLLFSARHSHD